MFVDLITLIYYFTKLFGIHGNIFTCRHIKEIKTGACGNACHDPG